jgi:hypothetical protein
MEEEFLNIRTKLLSLPHKLATRCEMSPASEVLEIAMDCVRESLYDLAGVSPDPVEAERWRQRYGLHVRKGKR